MNHSDVGVFQPIDLFLSFIIFRLIIKKCKRRFYHFFGKRLHFYLWHCKLPTTYIHMCTLIHVYCGCISEFVKLKAFKLTDPARIDDIVSLSGDMYTNNREMYLQSQMSIHTCVCIQNGAATDKKVNRKSAEQVEILK